LTFIALDHPKATPVSILLSSAAGRLQNTRPPTGEHAAGRLHDSSSPSHGTLQPGAHAHSSAAARRSAINSLTRLTSSGSYSLTAAHAGERRPERAHAQLTIDHFEAYIGTICETKFAANFGWDLQPAA
jgi:hypothetical protein